MPPLPHAPLLALACSTDLDELAAMRHAEGWITNRWLLRLLGDWPRAAVFTLRERSAASILGTISATAYGVPSVIGNVIVRPEARGRGYGKLLMAAALDWIQAQDARTVYLDATTAGQPLYRQCGFAPMYHTWEVWQPLVALRLADPLTAPGWQIVSLAPDTLNDVAELDRAAFGGDRLGLLAAMLSLAEIAGIAARDARTGALEGYLFIRPLEAPRVGVYVGPFVARSPDAARALLLEAVRRARAVVHPADETAAYLCVGLPGDSGSPALRLYRALGIAVNRDDLRMRLDLTASGAPGALNASEDGQPAWLYGMLSAMVG